MLRRVLLHPQRASALLKRSMPPRKRGAQVAPGEAVVNSPVSPKIATARAASTPTATPPPAGRDGVALKKKAIKLARQLNALYPNPPIPLDHESPFQLLVAVVLSAQTTDKKVNQVTPKLFDVAPDALSMAKLEPGTIQEIIKEIGLAKTKATNLSKTAKMLVEQHQGEVPGTFEELEALAGVGHKTASVVMAQAFGHPSFPVDTHIHRLAQRWGLTDGKNVVQTENDLKAIFPESIWNDIHLQIIFFGREHCPAQRHDPSGCPICSWAAVPPYDQPGFSPLKPGQSPSAAKKSKSKTSKAEPNTESPSRKRGLTSKYFKDVEGQAGKSTTKRTTRASK